MRDFEFYDVTGYEIVDNYVLRVFFDDNSEQIIDFEPILLGPLFGSLRDLDLFRRVELNREIGTLVWPNGADIDPLVLHDWPKHVNAIIKRRQDQFAVAS
ncbi:MAG: DUF2442 domain-containing protein [Chloroflexi bacterium]|nr:DUF2442 domain-containing protein [Chloroflexota bacterium]